MRNNVISKYRVIIMLAAVLTCTIFFGNGEVFGVTALPDQPCIPVKLLSSQAISDGIKLEIYEATIDNKPNPVQVLKADLNNSLVSIGAMTGTNHKLTAPRTVMEMAKDYGAIAGINADFYNSPTAPMGIHIENGQLMESPGHLENWFSFGIDRAKKAHIEKLDYKATVSTDNGHSFELYGYNKSNYPLSHEDRLNLYDKFWGEKVQDTFIPDTIMSKAVVVNNKVTQMLPQGGEVTIPENGYVLVGEGVAAEFINNYLQPGVQLTVNQALEPNLNLVTAVGGYMLLVNRGKVVNDLPDDDYQLLRHPRTAVGIGADQKQVWLITVEGWPNSPGMTLAELSQLMVQFGIDSGINMDGGKCSTMVARLPGDSEPSLINHPKLGVMWPVPNGIGVFSAASPSDTKTSTAGVNKTIYLQIGNPLMKINNIEQEIDPGRGTVPTIQNGCTMLPIRAIIEAVGGNISWDAESRKITIKMENYSVIEMWIGNKTATVNGTCLPLNIAPQSINGRTMAPLRFVSESLGCKVVWNDALKTITVYCTDSSAK